jgi:hypothetical protein
MAMAQIFFDGVPLGVDLSPTSRVAIARGIQPGGGFAIDITWIAEPPTLVSAATNVAGDELTLVFSAALTEDVQSLFSAFVLNGSALGEVDALISVSGDTVVLSISGTVLSSETLTLDYTAPTNNGLRDIDGNKLATFATEPVTNNVSP